MPQNTTPAASAELSLSQASAFAMAQAELAGAASISLVMFNAAQAQQGCQQIELTAVGVVCAKIVTSAAS
jgi:Killing trait